MFTFTRRRLLISPTIYTKHILCISALLLDYMRTQLRVIYDKVRAPRSPTSPSPHHRAGYNRSNEKSVSSKISGTDLNALTTEVVILFLGVAVGTKISGLAAVEEDFGETAVASYEGHINFRRAVSEK